MGKTKRNRILVPKQDKDLRSRQRARLRKQARVFSFRADESWEERHERRLKFACRRKNVRTVRHWCLQHGIQLEVTPSGRNWCFSRDGVVAMWEPYSATCMVTGGLRQHVHDWTRLQPLLETVFDVCCE